MEDGSDTLPTGGTALTRDEGRAKIASLLDPRPTPDKAPKQSSEPPHEDAPEREAPDNSADDHAEAPASHDEARSDDETPPEAVAETPRVRLKDGSEVTLDEVEDWRKGTLRQSDYTRKTQELATSRKEIEQRHAAIAEQQQHFSQAIDVAMKVVEARMPSPPDTSMLEMDPIGYIQQKEAYEAAVSEMASLVRAKNENDAKTKAEQKRTFDNWASKEHETLLDRLPDLKDPKRAKAFLDEVSTALPEYGFAKEDLANLYDHRLVLVLRDAVAYRKLKAATPKALDKAKDAQPVQQPGRRSSPDDARVKAMQENRQKLRKTGDKRVGQKLIADILFKAS